jgi:hypothetical protein
MSRETETIKDLQKGGEKGVVEAHRCSYEVGHYDKAGRFHIDRDFTTSTSDAVRAPSRQWPFSELKHSSTQKYHESLAFEKPDIYCTYISNRKESEIMEWREREICKRLLKTDNLESEICSFLQDENVTQAELYKAFERIEAAEATSKKQEEKKEEVLEFKSLTRAVIFAHDNNKYKNLANLMTEVASIIVNADKEVDVNDVDCISSYLLSDNTKENIDVIQSIIETERFKNVFEELKNEREDSGPGM